MKRWTIISIAVVMFLSAIPTMSAADTYSIAWLDTTRLNQGAVGIKYIAPKNKRTRVVVAFDSRKYTYELKHTSGVEYFALQSGSGTYKITIFEQVKGNQYKIIHTTSVISKLDNVQDIYLNSVQNVNWAAADKATTKAKELTRGNKSDMDKVRIINDYIINNLDYDYDLADQMKSSYIPDIDETLSSGNAICYGYASVFAAMLRSLDIPTKLVMGHTSYVESYHAWNEVLIDDEWIIIDTTVDYAYKNSKQKISFIKNAKNYSADQVF